MKRVKKVVAYIICNNRLLVFKHRDFPEVGIQVPAGTVENPDDLENEVLREAEEETGLKNLRIVKYLGKTDWDASFFRPEIHERHFFHLQADPPQPEKWLHYEMTPTGGGKPIALNIFWCDIKEAVLFGDQGCMLNKI
ncbi:MAG: NUDIX domain-containing protein [Alphaproteobacteria bacterium]|nr:NUDIX domain-containing protein [Alphaproteobacteria bacterium]